MTPCTDGRGATRYATWFAILAAIAPLREAVAAIVAVGAVTPLPVTTTGTALVIGDDQSTVSDTRAWVTINGGTAIQYSTLVVGDEVDFYGELHVDANFINNLNTRLTFTAQGTNNNPTVQIGNAGTGRLDIGGGATMSLTNSSGDMSLGVATTGLGYVTITDPFTIVNVAENLFVGQQGTGYLDVVNGATLNTIEDGASHAVTIGSAATAMGEVVVDGENSLLKVGSNLVVGGLGQGRLVIGQGARVDVDNWNNAAVTVGPAGRLEMAGGTLLGNTPTTGFGTTVNGYLGGTGTVRGTVSFGDDSYLEVGPEDRLVFTGNVSNQGAATVRGGELQFLAGLTNNAEGTFDAPGRISLENGGTVRFAQTLVNNGVLSSAIGATNIHGEITNQNAIVVARDTVATFHDSVNNTTGTITVKPGGNALFLADLSFVGLSLLQLGLSTDDLGDTSAQITAGGAVTLGGTLEVTFEGGYTPTVGDSFELISAGDGISGYFSAISLPLVPSDVQPGVIYGENSVRVEFRIDNTAIDLPGDYNNDEIVDAGDYVWWRNHFGQNVAVTNEHPDALTPGFVDLEDYGFWKANYGESLTGGSGGLGSPASSASPEPGTATLIVLAAIGLAVPRRLRRHR